jgi:hypothetical protein
MSNSREKIWMFPTLPSEPNKFDPSSSIFRQDFPYNYNCILYRHVSGRFYSEQEMVLHCKDPTHCDLVRDLVKAHTVTKVETFHCHRRHDAMYPRIEKLGLPAWQEKVRSSLCLYLGSIGKDTEAFNKADNHLLWYEHMERISLLELAAWKAACVLDMEQKEGQMMYNLLEWIRYGWKQNKTKMRHSNATHVIVENVVSFLEGPRKITEAKDSLAIFFPRRK